MSPLDKVQTMTESSINHRAAAPLPLLFLTGVSWPQSSIPGAWQGVSWLFPSTFGVRAFIRVNSMGASVSQILPEVRILWIQAAAYLGMACLVYRHQFRLASLK